MAEEKKRAQEGDQGKTEEVFIPDFSELWKELYFRTEDAWSEAFREFISTKSFVQMMDHMLEQHLFYEKAARQQMDRYFEASPVPSKKDIARVAELVLSLEEKVDGLETQFGQALQSLADNLLKMVQHQENLHKELAGLRQENQSLSKKLEGMNKKLNTLSKEKSTARKKAQTQEKPAAGDQSNP